MTIAWLKELGINYVSVGDEKSEEPFKPWQDPHQLDGRLTEVWRDGGDAIPRGAQVEKTPVFYLERDALLRFVGALEGPQSNGGVLTWLSSRNARIDASPRAGDAISLQIAHDPRWKAKVVGKEWPIRADGLGQMWINPQLFLLCAVAWMLLLGSLTSFQFPFAPREKP